MSRLPNVIGARGVNLRLARLHSAAEIIVHQEQNNNNSDSDKANKTRVSVIGTPNQQRVAYQLLYSSSRGGFVKFFPQRQEAEALDEDLINKIAERTKTQVRLLEMTTKKKEDNENGVMVVVLPGCMHPRPDDQMDEAVKMMARVIHSRYQQQRHPSLRHDDKCDENLLLRLCRRISLQRVCNVCTRATDRRVYVKESEFGHDKSEQHLHSKQRLKERRRLEEENDAAMSRKLDYD